MADPFIISVEDRTDVMADPGTGIAIIPGIGEFPLKLKGNLDGETRYLGRGGAADASGPWVYWNLFRKGSVIKYHSHNANRIEYLLGGKIEFRQPGKEPRVFGAGNMTYVEAGTVYGFEVLEDVTILLVYDKAPGYSML
jgi:hypothetical protein